MKAVTHQTVQLLVLIVVAHMALLGCALPPHRSHPEFNQRYSQLEDSRGLLVTDVQIYKWTAAGKAEHRQDLSRTGQANVSQAIVDAFKEKNFTVVPLPSDTQTTYELLSVRDLYRVVNKSIQLHTYGPQLFPLKVKQFEYSVGDLQAILDRYQVDAIVFANGVDQQLDGGRKTFISIAIADPSGTIVWYCVDGSQGEHDLQDPSSTLALVKDVLTPLPKVTP